LGLLVISAATLYSLQASWLSEMRSFYNSWMPLHLPLGKPDRERSFMA